MPRRLTMGVLVVAVATTCGVVALNRAGSEAAPPGSPSAFRTSVMAHEHAIADCMAERGFTYVPALPADVLLEEARAAAEAEGRDLEAALEAVELPEDPNEAILAALPPERAASYADAYWGDEDEQGCYYETYEQAWGVDILSFGAALDASLPDVERQIAADPRIIAAKATFVACMSEQGYGFESVDDIRTYEGRQTSAVSARLRSHDSGADSTRHPLWLAHEAAMTTFRDATSECQPAYDQTVRPIENDYLTRMAEEIKQGRTD